MWVVFDSVEVAVFGSTCLQQIFVRESRGLDRITWTTGAWKAGTTGPTGITRCGNTWANIFKKLPSAFRDARTGPVDSLNLA